MPKIQIFPGVPLLVTEGLEVTDASVPGVLPQDLRTASRVVVTDTEVLAGSPAAAVEADAAAIRDAVLALPALVAARTARDALRDAEIAAVRRAELARAIKAECARRIYAVMKDDRTQLNITGLSVDLVNRKLDGETLSEADAADLALASALKTWVAATMAISRQLAADGDMTFADAQHWPAAPAGAAAFAARF